MNENNTAKWLNYLFYVGIAAMGNTVLSLFLSDVSSWITPILTLAALFMMSRMVPSNGRYLRVILFSGVSVLISVLNIQQVALAGGLCSILGQYQEYTAHGELIQQWKPKLADRWIGLFFFQLSANGILLVMSALFLRSAGENAELITAVLTVIVAVITLILKVVYLIFLRSTIRILKTEAAEA